MNHIILILEIVYIIILIVVCLRIIYDTDDSTKTLAYLTLVILLPIIGIAFYFVLGVNYRKNKLYDKKLMSNGKLYEELEKRVLAESRTLLAENEVELGSSKKLINLLLTDSRSPLTDNNAIEILINGEKKFPALLEALRAAKDHIHIEYYIFVDDETGCEIEEVLKQKAQEGVKVKVMYDDFGSQSIRKKMIPRLKAAGVETAPFYEIKFMAFANRINYRNHRKIVIIDGHTGFVGGINVSNDYINRAEDSDDLFWRDSHMKIVGDAVYHLQYIFMGDWNFCADASLAASDQYFPSIPSELVGDKIVQLASSGPDSDTAAIHNSIVQAIFLAKEEINITTPYFVPTESIMNALRIVSSSGVKVKLLVPRESDSAIVDAASSSYYTALMEANVEVYRYGKGFIHAKTLVIDEQLCMIGTANMDIRSFDLNFEVNAIIYDHEISKNMRLQFDQDLLDATLIIPENWAKRSWWKQLWENLARLLSPIL